MPSLLIRSGVARVIRVFVRSQSEGERFGAANTDLTSTALRVNRIFALALPALMAILNLSSVAVVWFGGRLVSEGSMPIGNLTAFLAYILQILIAERSGWWKRDRTSDQRLFTA